MALGYSLDKQLGKRYTISMIIRVSTQTVPNITTPPPADAEMELAQSWTEGIDELLDKAERCARADRQEQQVVAIEKKRGNISYRIDREIDTLTFDKNGYIWLTDCKFSDDFEFWIEKPDVNKMLNEARKIEDLLGKRVEVKTRVDMHFPRTKARGNRRYIVITEADRDWTIRCDFGNHQIKTTRVRR